MANFGYIQITRRCNQRCRFCSNPAADRDLDFKTIKEIINQFADHGYTGVIFTGGEPTCSELLPQAIEYAKNMKFSVKIITNGQKTADKKYLETLVKAGLEHINLSLYSDDKKVQNFLTDNDKSFENIKKTLSHLNKESLSVDILTAISKYNASHLSRTVRWIVKKYSFVRHFVWNNLDPLMNRSSEYPDTVPQLIDFEVELFKAMLFLWQKGKTFRVERVPLCYMAEFAHCSTEARKIIKNEERATYFLDEKGLIYQKGWKYAKLASCRFCSLDCICPGLYAMGSHFSGKALYPVFIDKNEIINRVKHWD